VNFFVLEKGRQRDRSKLTDADSLGIVRENVGIPYNPTLHIFYKMYYTWVYLCRKSIPVGEKTFGAPTPSCGFLCNTLLLPGD